MFDIGFSELLLFGVIALIVLGPEKLPQAARTAGQWYAKIRRTISTLQSEIEAELDLAETRQQMQKEMAKIRETEAEMRREMAEMRGSMQEFESSQNQSLKGATTDKASELKPNQASPTTSSDTDSTDTQLTDDPLKQSQPAAFNYDYESHAANRQSSAATSEQNDHESNHQEQSLDDASPMMTRPWENMWFLLGDYDRARRLPAPPYLPNYTADTLLNARLDDSAQYHASIQKTEAE